MSERASIIIPVSHGLDPLRRCVESVWQHTPDVPYEIIAVDYVSTAGLPEWCMRQGIPFVSPPVNKGLPAACNLGLRMAAGETLVLLNNDSAVTSGWLDNLSTALYSDPSVGIVGPVTNGAAGCQRVHYPFDDLDEFHRIAEEVNVSSAHQWKEVNRLEGFCLVFRRSVMERIGLLDERFNPGYYEDDDYCYRARMAGFRLLVCQDCLIYHEGRAGFRVNDSDPQKAIAERNCRRFKEKWNLDPRALPRCAGGLANGPIPGEVSS